MNEITTNKKVVNIMPGSDRVTGDVKAYPLQNTIIAGKNGSGVITLVNGIISNLVQNYSPSEVGIEYYSLCEERDPWLNPNRQLPHFSTQRYGLSDGAYTVPEDFRKLFSRLGEILSIAVDRQYTFEKGKDKEYVVILELSPSMFIDIDKENDLLSNGGYTLAGGSNWNMLHTLMELCESAGIYVLLVVMHDVFGLHSFVDLCGLRLTTRLEEGFSNKIMGCNLSFVERQDSGFVWVSHKEDTYTKTRLNVKFLPDTYLSKFCKIMSAPSKVATDDYSDMSDRLRNWSEDEVKLVKNQIKSLSHATNKSSYPLHGLDDIDKTDMLFRLQDVISSCYRTNSPRD